MFGAASIHDNLSRVILGFKIEKIHLNNEYDSSLYFNLYQTCFPHISGENRYDNSLMKGFM